MTTPTAVESPQYPRTRLRQDSFKFDKETVVERIKGFYDQDISDRGTTLQDRVQRYAKYRGWTSGETSYEGGSDVSVPDMMTSSLRVQDTLHNAVISSRPSIISKASNKINMEKQETIDGLLDHQFFVESQGETLVGEMAELFINDGDVTVFIPWVREKRKINEVQVFGPIPQEMMPVEYFQAIIQQKYPTYQCEVETGGWDWKCSDPEKPDEKMEIAFYTRNDQKVEMVVKMDRVVFEGPSPQVKDFEDVLYPTRASNLQIPGPSNPGGSSHVILVDYPTIDEIKRLIKAGFYDQAKVDDLKGLTDDPGDSTTESIKVAKDDIQGTTANVKSTTEDEEDQEQLHKTVTRLICFDMYDVDGDGLAEDVMWWMILEDKILLKSKLLSEMYPGPKPYRPFGEAQYLPVKGRKAGISMLEQMEGLHDLLKATLDFTVDTGSFSTSPFFFYRASGSMRPEIIRLAPGEGYPLSNPQQDVNFPTLPNQGAAFGINLMTWTDQAQQKLSMVGDLQYGRVPAGKASALRTTQGIQTILGQGEARPERILRRFFLCMCQIWWVMNQLNQNFLPKDKQYRITGFQDKNEDPYRTVSDRSKIGGAYEFEFTANMFNSSKAALQQSMDQIVRMFINPLAMQMGMIDADKVYKMWVDWAKAYGQDATKYINKPTPQSDAPKIRWEEALSMLLNEQMPQGLPEEPIEEHLQDLLDFQHDPKFGLLTAAGATLYKAYLNQLGQALQVQKQQQAMMQATQHFQQSAGPPGSEGGGGGAPPDMSQAPLSGGGEIMDESMPSAGGGANASPAG